MELYFRPLTLDDIHAVFDLCKNIWKDENGVSEDYLPKVIKEWILDDERYTFGAFKDEKMTILIALGSIKIISADLAWMEGGRVAEEYQRKGIGKILTQYCIDYAKSKKIKYIQYDTFSQNDGSISLAKSLGYYQKDYMELLEGKLSEISGIDSNISPFSEISSDEAFRFLKEIPNGPKTEICAGWSFRPFNLKQISNIKGKWIRNDEAIVLKIGSDDSLEGENPVYDELWLIIYGKILAVKDLLKGVLIEEKKSQNSLHKLSIRVFCPSALSKSIQELGFSYIDGKPSGVVIFEKRL